MTAFLLYLVKAALATALLYLVYPATIKGSTLHRAGRAYLLAAAAAGCLLPLLTFHFHRTLTLEEVSRIADLTPSSVPAIPAIPTAEQIDLSAGHNGASLLLAFYLAGAAWTAVRLLAAHSRVLRIIRRSERIAADGKAVTVRTDDPIAPCSWMHYILLPRRQSGAGWEELLAHERAHVALHHSADLLLVDLVGILQWFNPAIRWLRTDLCTLHEYQADEAVLRGGAQRKAYQYLLLQHSLAVRGLAVVGRFGSSRLKARIRMMGQPRTALRKGWLLLCALPVLCTVLLANVRIESERYNAQRPPLLLFEHESVSLEELLQAQDLEGGTIRVIPPEEAARFCGRHIPGGILSITPPVPQTSDGRISFHLVPGFDLTDPDQFPLLLVNGVEFPYLRRKEFQGSRWAWKWFAYLHPDQAVPIYGEKAHNGAFILNVELL